MTEDIWGQTDFQIHGFSGKLIINSGVYAGNLHMYTARSQEKCDGKALCPVYVCIAGPAFGQSE